MQAKTRVRLRRPKINQKVAQVLTHISPNTLQTCLENYRESAIQTKKSQVF
jgi:hypothetical protein